MGSLGLMEALFLILGEMSILFFTGAELMASPLTVGERSFLSASLLAVGVSCLFC